MPTGGLGITVPVWMAGRQRRGNTRREPYHRRNLVRRQESTAHGSRKEWLWLSWAAPADAHPAWRLRCAPRTLPRCGLHHRHLWNTWTNPERLRRVERLRTVVQAEVQLPRRSRFIPLVRPGHEPHAGRSRAGGACRVAAGTAPDPTGVGLVAPECPDASGAPQKRARLGHPIQRAQPSRSSSSRRRSSSLILIWSSTRRTVRSPLPVSSAISKTL